MNAPEDAERFRLVVVSAGTSDPSSTRLLADRTAGRAAALAARHGNTVTISVIDLREISADISTAVISRPPEDWSDPALATRIDRAALELVLLMESGFARAIKDESWQSYQHEYGSAGGTETSIDLDTGLMRLATGGSAS